VAPAVNGLPSKAAIADATGKALDIPSWCSAVAGPRGAPPAAHQRARLATRGGVRDMLVEILSVAVTADPEKLREPYGFSLLLEAKFNELEGRFKGRTDDWLDLLEVISTRLPQYGDYRCAYAVGERYLTLLGWRCCLPRL